MVRLAKSRHLADLVGLYFVLSSFYFLSLSVFEYFPKDMFIDFRERGGDGGGGRERDRERQRERERMRMTHRYERETWVSCLP